jgi:hypothetical protein
MNNEMPYSVTFWFGDPETPEGDDCCTAGSNFATLKEAREFFENPEKWSDDFAPSCFSGCAWTMLDGPDVHEVRFDAAVKRGSDEEDRLLRNEHRMQAGMMGGCDAYNDADDEW